MTTYAALVRGIGPGDPQKTNEKLRGALETLGFTNVKSVISSGNLIFDSDETDVHVLEDLIEDAWPNLLGFEATTIVRSKEQLQHIVGLDHFHGLEHGTASYLLVTFFKQPITPPFDLPFTPPGKPYKVIAYDDGVLFTVTDNTIVKTTDLMTWIEKQFTKNVTSRTPLTIERVIKKMSDSDPT